MKFAMTFLILIISPFAFSQGGYFEIKQDFLSNHSALGAADIDLQRQQLEKSLSFSLQDKVTRKSELFSISNMAEIKRWINKEKRVSRPNLPLQLNTFEGDKPIRIKINNISNSQGREILRGDVEGHAGSRVKLVIHNNDISGRITYADSRKVLVIQSDKGVTAVYEIDVSDITYD